MINSYIKTLIVLCCLHHSRNIFIGLRSPHESLLKWGFLHFDCSLIALELSKSVFQIWDVENFSLDQTEEANQVFNSLGPKFYVSSPVTRQEAAAAKQIIENHYQHYLQGLQDCKERRRALQRKTQKA